MLTSTPFGLLASRRWKRAIHAASKAPGRSEPSTGLDTPSAHVTSDAASFGRSPTRAKTRRPVFEPALPSTSVTAPPHPRVPTALSGPPTPRTAFLSRMGAEERAQDDVRSRREAEETAREAQVAAEEGGECGRMHAAVLAAMLQRVPQLTASLALASVHERVTGCRLSAAEEEIRVRHFIETTVSAFLYNDLLMAGRDLLRHAMGSFGVVLSHSLECDDSVIIGARGQTMSVGFYPELGMVLFGSEQAATKAAMGFTPVGCGNQGGRGQRAKWRKAGMTTDSSEHAMDSSKTGEAFNPVTNHLKGSFRLDLDDLGVSAEGVSNSRPR